jgi:hypothetical protein
MTDNGTRWQNRIVEYGTKRADQFQAHPRNWRLHPKHQRDALAASLNSVGWVGVVLENVRTGHLLDGHERLWQALQQGDETPVPYIAVDVNEDEEHLVLTTLDPISAMAATDAEMLGDMLADLRETELVQDDAELRKLLNAVAGRTLPPPDVDYEAHWQGMPEFEQDDLTAAHSVKVHFGSLEDLQAFAELVGQKLTEKTRSIWYPEAQKIDMTDIYVNES